MNDTRLDDYLISKGRDATDDFLAHHGILGMKWGIRKDGKPQGWQGGSGKGSSFKKGVTKVAKGTARTAKRTATKVRAEIESSKARRANAKAEQKLTAEANQKDNLDYDARRRVSNSYKIASTTRSAQTLSRHMDVLTDAELQARINRLQKEETVRRMAAEERDRNRSWVSKTLEKSAKQSVAGIATYGMTKAGKMAIDGLFEKAASNSGGADGDAAKSAISKASEKIRKGAKSSRASTSSSPKASTGSSNTPTNSSSNGSTNSPSASTKISSDSFVKMSKFGRSHMSDMVNLNEGVSGLFGSVGTQSAIDKGASFVENHISAELDRKIPKV